MATTPPPAATIDYEGYAEATRAFRRYARQVDNGSSEMRTAAGRVAAPLAARIQAKFSADSDPRSPILALTVRVKRDRVPAVTVGGSRKLFSAGTQQNVVSAGRVLFGTEFGAHTRTGGYRSWSGNGDSAGYVFYPTLRASADITYREYGAMLLDLARQWGLGG